MRATTQPRLKNHRPGRRIAAGVAATLALAVSGLMTLLAPAAAVADDEFTPKAGDVVLTDMAPYDVFLADHGWYSPRTIVVPVGTEKSVDSFGLPVSAEAHRLQYQGAGKIPTSWWDYTDINWDLDSLAYEATDKEPQKITVKGRAALPEGVLNPKGVSLEATATILTIPLGTVRVFTDWESGGNVGWVSFCDTDRPAKTVEALGLPQIVSYGFDEYRDVQFWRNDSADAPIVWDVEHANYDPASGEWQEFDVTGQAKLPTGALTFDAVPLEVIYHVSVCGRSIGSTDAPTYQPTSASPTNSQPDPSGGQTSPPPSGAPATIPTQVKTAEDVTKVVAASKDESKLSDADKALLSIAQEQAHAINQNSVYATLEGAPWYVKMVSTKLSTQDAALAKALPGKTVLGHWDFAPVDLLTEKPWQPPSGQPAKVYLNNFTPGSYTNLAVAMFEADGSIKTLPLKNATTGSSTVTVAQRVLVDQDEVKITVTGFKETEYGIEFTWLIENNREQSITVQARDVSVNGFMITGVMSTEVTAGKKANSSIQFGKSDLQKNGVDVVKDLQLSFDVFNWSTGTIFKSALLDIKTSASTATAGPTPTTGYYFEAPHFSKFAVYAADGLLPFTTAPTPKITGTAKVGQTLTADPGTWSPKPTGFTYQWLRDGVAISGATSATYTLTAEDAGKKISVEVTAILAGYTATKKTSEPVTEGLLPFTAAPVPTITGTAKVGSTLTAVTGTWSPVPTFTYQWLRDGKAITGATSTTYVLTAADAGHQVSVQVTGGLAGYVATTKTSQAVTVAAAQTDTHGGNGDHGSNGTWGRDHGETGGRYGDGADRSDHRYGTTTQTVNQGTTTQGTTTTIQGSANSGTQTTDSAVVLPGGASSQQAGSANLLYTGAALWPVAAAVAMLGVGAWVSARKSQNLAG